MERICVDSKIDNMADVISATVDYEGRSRETVCQLWE